MPNDRNDHREEFRRTALQLIRRIKEEDEVSGREIEASLKELRLRLKAAEELDRPRKKPRTMRWVAAAAAMALLLATGSYWLLRKERVRGETGLSLSDASRQIDSNQVILATGSKSVNLTGNGSLRYEPSGRLSLFAQSQAIDHAARVNRLIVPYGKRADVTFSDGSRMYLNSGSSATYPVKFPGDRREIRLKGEAYLEVSPDNLRPFVVQTSDFSVKVLGTAFNVQAYPGEKEPYVVLAKGHIQIMRAGHDTIRLDPGQKADITGQGVRVSRVNPDEYTSWKDNLLLVSHKSTGEILDQLQRYYGYRIEASPEIKAMRLSGKLDLREDLGHVIENISLSLSLHYRIDEHRRTIVLTTNP